MSILRKFLRTKTPKSSASIAKERLQIIVSHQRSERNQDDFLPLLQKELVEVIAKYVDIDLEQVHVELERQGDRSVLELNVTLPDLTANAIIETEAE